MAGTEWWRGAVLYHIYPRSFLDSDGNGIGDLTGIERRLDHVAALGADGVWLCPFFRSPMKDFGYDVSDYRDVDPMFGTLADFDRLLDRAHALGLKVIVDMVISHTSDRHPWFAESRASRTGPKADWYVWADPKPDGTPPNNWLSVFGGPAWQWDTERRQYYLHNFLPSQPDLNLHNPETLDAVFAELAFWLDRGVDGFRLDTANFYLHDPLLRDNPPRPAEERGEAEIPLENPYGYQYHVYDKSRPENLPLLRRLRTLLDRYRDRMAVGEVACDLGVKRIAEYCASPDLLHTAYSFDLLSHGFSAGRIRRVVEGFFAEPGDAWPSWAFSNHDVIRAVTRWGGPDAPPAFAKLLPALLTSLAGTAFLYQGEELGLPEADIPYERLQDPYGLAFWPKFKGRDGCRTPMPWHHAEPHAGFSPADPWLPVPDTHVRRAVDLQKGDPASVLEFCRAFLHWRRGRPELRYGEIRFFDTLEPLLAFERALGTQRLLAAFNLGDRAIVQELSCRAHDAGVPGATGTVKGTTLSLPGYGMAFGEIDEGD